MNERETTLTKTNCPDCGATPGELHKRGCDVENCPGCGRQLLGCCCSRTAAERRPWTGFWPGTEECVEFGFWTPEGTPDLNRLYTECLWDRAAQRWKPR